MRLTHEQKDARHLKRWLDRLTPAARFYGILGRGYPNSFYKLYIQPTPPNGVWYRFEWYDWCPRSSPSWAYREPQTIVTGTLLELVAYTHAGENYNGPFKRGMARTPATDLFAHVRDMYEAAERGAT